MIGFVRGKLVVKAPPHLTVDVGGVGYDIEAPMSTFYTLPAVGASTRVAIGLHVTLTAPFRPLTRDFAPARDGAFPRLAPLMARAFLGRLDRAKLAAEIAAQLAAFAAAFGRPPDFVDGHQHVQLLPTV